MSETIDAVGHAVDHPAPDGSNAPSTMHPPSGSAPLPPPVLQPAPPPVAQPAPPAAAQPAPPPVVTPPPAPAPPAPPTPSPTPTPSAVFAPDAAAVPAVNIAPMLPSNVAAKPSAPAATTNTAGSTAFDVGSFLSTQKESRKSPPKPRSRWFVRLVMVGLLGAGGWVGVEHGPDLYDQYIDGDEADAQNEPEAPRAFPNTTAAAAPIRTAEFSLTGLAETPGATYRVTTDFETSVSQVDIRRDSGPDLQILTYGTDAMIRRADGEQWYILDRGQFPLDGRLQRTDWVRRVDELLPIEARNAAVIESATRATIAGVATRHLTLTVDPGLLGIAPDAELGTVDAVVSLDEVQPVEQPVDQSDVAGTVGDVADGVTAEVAPSGVRMEIWIDAEGLVRQVSGVPQLGADTITILTTSPDAWIPDYPIASEIAPLTASALIELGI